MMSNAQGSRSIWMLGVLGMALTMAACGGSEKPSSPPGATAPAAPEAKASTPANELYTAADLALADVDQGMAAKGKATSEMKCTACHSMGENRIVGPGWKGITTKREPAWIMNMIVHTDAMLETDPEAQKMLEECLVRMPNQNLSHDEAREVLEYMRTL